VAAHSILLIVYSALLLALGLFVSKRVTSTAAFFVAGRSLTPTLVFSTVLAANIGAGSTVGATGIGYRDGLSAWWWSGSAGLGSLLLAFWIGPKIWAQASRLGLLTTGDLLEHHFGSGVRAAVSGLIWVASLSILAGQLIGVAWILNVVMGLPKWAGCLVGGGLMTTYFAAGGLLGSVWVNLVQLVVLLAGFLVAVPVAIGNAGGLGAVMAAAAPAGRDAFWNGSASIAYLVLLVPSFLSSPGLLQKAFAARDGQAVRKGIGWNAVALLFFAFVPALLGMAARVRHPGLSPELALPTLLAHDLPAGFGSILLAAIFSAEVSTADAVLFMLATSLSQDLYRRFVRPGATDAQVLRVARRAAVVGGALGVALALVMPTIQGALSFFYAMIGATVFVPVIASVHARPGRHREIAVSIACGVVAVVWRQLTGFPAGTLWTPATLGLLAASAGFGVAVLARRAPDAHRKAAS
jgi:SSS family solute:Na+ symporter